MPCSHAGEVTNAPRCPAHRAPNALCAACGLYQCAKCDVLGSAHMPRASITAAHRARALRYSLARDADPAARSAWLERGDFGTFDELPAIAQAIADTLKGEPGKAMSCYEVVKQVDGRWAVRWEGSSYHLGHDPNLFATRDGADAEVRKRNARDGFTGEPDAFDGIDKPRV